MEGSLRVSALAEYKSKRYSKGNLLRKLYNREVFGQFIHGVSIHHEPTKQLFSKVPNHLIFGLCDTIPDAGKHILIGVTRCGQILLTYSFRVYSSFFSSSSVYSYTLHFWLFRPGQLSDMIGEVQLFDGAQVEEMLTIGIAQWPHDNTRVLVFGSYQESNSVHDLRSDVEFKSSTYITLTTLPSLQGCDKCKPVASTFSEEEMMADGDVSVGPTCFNHGLTIHTYFSAPHFYTFDPETCLASDGRIVFNTGSFLHVLSMRVENGLETSTHDSSTAFENRLTFSFLRRHKYSIFMSDNWDCNMIQLLIKKLRRGLHTDKSQLNVYLQYALERHLLRRSDMKCKFSTDKGLSCGQLAVTLLDANNPKRKFFTLYNHKVKRTYSSSNKKDKFDFVKLLEDDEGKPSAIPTSVPSRKKEENVKKRTKVVSLFLSGLGKGAFSRRKSNRRTTRHNHPSNEAELTGEMIMENKTGLGHQPVSGCTVVLDRRFADHDSSSQIEDAHCTLPISAHGSRRMTMISDHVNSLPSPLVLVRQNSLDAEQLAFKAATAICKMEGCKFWFYSDYRNEIVKVCQATGEVFALLFIRLNVDYFPITSKRNKADLHNFYETSCLYIWNPTDGIVYLQGYSDLEIAPTANDRPWRPARKNASVLKKTLNLLPAHAPRLFIHDIKTGTLSPPADRILDRDNLIGFRLHPRSVILKDGLTRK
ncbi:uncharacterized protein LOC106670815 isoform X2 [Cimex lectularius]|uniref:DDB1- and CUL4-associated factor 15 WD40 repeat-containing domain-containing protein n=1 Tax=Cimex lectularius TaxID=79782 RepID=A0A8I6SEB9_CIMLE|nr:uncharacterized protein LOC106670815 isoform X2 [Cimex lectularius]